MVGDRGIEPPQEPTSEPSSGEAPLRIDCDECTQQGTSVCDDCVVTYRCSRDPDDAVVVDVAEARALRLMADSGLVK